MKFKMITLILIPIFAFLMLPHKGFTSEKKIDVKLELEWGRGGLTRWDGFLSIKNGVFLDVWNILLEGKERFHQVSAHKIRWNSTTVGPTDGIGIRVCASKNALLTFSTLAGTAKIPLKEILRKNQKIRFARGHILLVRRKLRNVIFVQKDRENYIFTPGEQWDFHWILNLQYPINLNGLSYLQYISDDLVGDIIREPVVKNVNLNKEEVVHSFADTITIPEREGVYSLNIEIKSSATYTFPKLRAQFVVLDPSVLDHGPEKSTNKRLLVFHIDATNNNYTDNYFRDDGSSFVYHNKGVSYRVSGKKAYNISKQKDKRSSSWFAYRLNIRRPGKPHMLEIKYPVDQVRRFAVNILEKNPNPKARATNKIDQGIAVAAKDIKAGGELYKTKKIVFWPTTNHPTIAFVNTLKGHRAAVKEIRLYEFPFGLPNHSVREIKGRHTGVYFEEPRLIRCLGGHTIPDPNMHVGSCTRSDWTTYYTVVKHLAEYLRYMGQDSVLLPVYAYGGSLYPSAYLPNNGRYDNGDRFFDGRQIAQKDIVRLILDVFERNHLSLIPTFVFYTSLPQLERDYPPYKNGIRAVDLINKNGLSSRKILKFGANSSIGPYYNPLHPGVQQVVKNIFKEFIQRYGDSTALGDIALQLNTSGWIQFPGLDWGYDRATFKKFCGDNKINVPLLNSSSFSSRRMYSFLTSDQNKSNWVIWRNKQLGRFYASLADIVHDAPGKRKLILAYMNIFTSRFKDDNPLIALRNGMTPRDLLSVKGVDPFYMAQSDKIILLRPIRVPVPFSRRKGPDGVSTSSKTIKLFQSAGASGAVLFFDYFETRNYNLQQKWWWPINYWTVTTFAYPNDYIDQYRVPSDKLFFAGGWQMPQ